jgi:circadian clock protein KaiC
MSREILTPSEGLTSVGDHEAMAKTGVLGLDDILNGGLTRGHSFLMEGQPGSGKTTIALQFLQEGARLGERSLYITLSETERELRQGAASHGWVLDDKVSVFELAPPESLLDSEQQQSLLYSSDLELGETTRAILDAVNRVNPTRIVLDSLGEIRLLAQSTLRYRRQVLAMKHYFARQGATVLMLDDMTIERQDTTVHSIAHAVVRLEQLSPEYGAERRRLRVVKYRGHRYRGGYHDFVIATGGVQVFPRLVSLEHHGAFDRKLMRSGIRGLDDLLGGGLETGSSTVVLGPSGTGKTLLAMKFIVAAVQRGEKAALFIFDEELGLLCRRMKTMGIDLAKLRDEGRVVIEQVDAAELSPGEFAHRVRAVVDSKQIKTVLIDSLNGYQAAMPQENQLVLHVHELLQYLNRRGAATFVTVAQMGLVGDMRSPFDITYLADTVVMLRYFEAGGAVRRAMSIVKKRTGAHETTIREYRISNEGLEISSPLVGFRGILRGTPEYKEDDVDARAPKA